MALLLALLLQVDADALIEQLSSKDAMERFVAAQELGKRGEKKALRALADTLTDTEAWVRLEAARALVRIGIKKEQVSVIVRRFERADPDLGFLLAEAAGGEGSRSESF